MDVRRSKTRRQAPAGIEVPSDLSITPPGPDISDEVGIFFGESGKWWGSWRSRQVKDGFDSIFVLTAFTDSTEATACLIVPDYPGWYIEKKTWKGRVTFTRQEDGGMLFSFSPTPFGERMHCRFTAQGLEGTVYTRFMKLEIIWKPVGR
jgi:hypothetical protein